MRALITGSTLLLLLAAGASPARGFETNGKHWDQMPIPYWINPNDCPVVEGEDGDLTIADMLELATGAWSSVACADVTFQYMGTTDKTWDADGQNVIYCVATEGEWSFGEGAAGATLWLPTGEGEPMEVDLALNALELEWVWGGGHAIAVGIMDPVAMLTHELGHWLGLAHTPDPYGTMYYALLPNGIQKSLEADDKAGLCSLYPNGEVECDTDNECEDGWTCKAIEGFNVCGEVHDGPGGFCNKSYINCDEMCWVSFYECSQICIFTDLMYTEGFCSPLCDLDDDQCPEGLMCIYVEEYDVSVCYTDPDYVAPEAQPEAMVEVVEIVEVVEHVEPFEVVQQPADLRAAPEPSADLQTMPERQPELTAQPDPGTAEPGGSSGGSGCAAPSGHDDAASSFLLLGLAALLLGLSRLRCRAEHRR